MSSSSLARDLGVLSGRFQKSPSGWTFVLGSVAEWQVEPLVSGDYTEIYQDIVPGAARAVQVRMRLKHPPLELTGGKLWGVQLACVSSMDSSSSPIRYGFPGQQREFELMSLFNVSYPGLSNRVSVRLVLQ